MDPGFQLVAAVAAVWTAGYLVLVAVRRSGDKRKASQTGAGVSYRRRGFGAGRRASRGGRRSAGRLR